MREVSQVFEQGFAVGLRPSLNLGPAIQLLMASMNLVPTSTGLEPREDVTNPIVDIAESAYPFPALYVLTRYVLLFTKSDLYLVDGSWELTHLIHHEWKDLPHIADFMDFVVFSTPSGQWTFDGAIVSDNVSGAAFVTCTNFRGQLIVGNCSLPKGPEKVEEEVVQDRISVGSTATVAWSKIGSLEWEYTLGNEVGWSPMPWLGSVSGLLPLGKEIVVYGENGLCKMSMAKEPVTTFGIQDFGDIGVLNRNCFAGDTTAHLFVGTDYNLYSVTPEKALSGEGKLPAKLGYQEWISQLSNPIVTFDSAKRHWWIGDEKTCFIFTGTGLGESSETPTHLSRLDGSLLGITFPHHSGEALVETGDISFDSRGFKTLMCVEGNLRAKKKVYGSTAFRSSYTEDERDSREILLDPRGAFFPVVAGTEIRVRFRCADFHNFYLSKLWLHFKNTDKTFSRGVINAGRPAE